MEVNNPRRILFIGPPDSGVLALLEELTGSSPTPRIVPVTETEDTEASSSSRIDGIEQSNQDPQSERAGSLTSSKTIATTAGLTHSLSLKNNYYQAEIPIWIDEASAPEKWQQDFLSDEAGEVIRAVGAWVVCFRLNQLVADSNTGAKEAAKNQSSETWIKSMMSAIRLAIENACGGFELWDGVLLCVGVPGYTAGRPTAQSVDSSPSGVEVEELCWELGFEYIDASVSNEGKNSSTGEATGIKRILEALEANDWEADPGEAGDDDFDFGEFNESSMTDRILGNDYANLTREEDMGFAIERREMEKEMLDLKLSLNDSTRTETEEGEEDDEAIQVEGLEETLSRVLAVKDMTAHMPEGERKRYAARAVRDIMKTL